MQQFSRISTNPNVMGGKPCIRCMRVTVGMIVEALAAGRTDGDLLRDFPYLEEQDIRQALAYAARIAQGREFPIGQPSETLPRRHAHILYRSNKRFLNPHERS